MSLREWKEFRAPESHSTGWEGLSGSHSAALSAVPASVLPSKSLIKLVPAIYLTKHFQSTWFLATREVVGKRAGENRES